MSWHSTPAWPPQLSIDPSPRRTTDDGPNLLPNQPHFGHLASTAAASSARLPIPGQSQISTFSGSSRNREFHGSDRIWLFHRRMNLNLVVGKKPNHSIEVVPCVNDSNFVSRCAIQICVAHLQRRVKQRIGMITPGSPPLRAICKSEQGRLSKIRILIESLSPN